MLVLVMGLLYLSMIGGANESLSGHRLSATRWDEDRKTWLARLDTEGEGHDVAQLMRNLYFSHIINCYISI